MDPIRYGVKKHPDYGFWQLDPLPTQEFLSSFYVSQYYELIKQGSRAPEISRFLKGGPDSDREREWLCETLYKDILDQFVRFTMGKRVIEVGCGVGDFLNYLQTGGFEVSGIEPSEEASQKARDRGVDVFAGDLAQFVQQMPDAQTYDIAVLLNVLEHVPDPIEIIELTRKLLTPGGYLLIRIPNDFSEIQAVAHSSLNCEPWWVARPDHVNYFDFASIRTFLEQMGFDVFYQQGDFPMEFFLLLGDIYIGDSETGQRCHEKRRRFEMLLPPSLRQKLYHAMGQAGLGRDSLTFARLQEQE